MKHKIDPTVDCVFKAIFGSEENKNVCIHFLNSILELKGKDKIRSITIKNPYNQRDFKKDKLSIIDVRVEDEKQMNYQIEIQVSNHAGLGPRILYTWCRVYHSLLKKGLAFSELKPVTSIWVLREPMFAIKDYYLDFCLYNRKHNIVLTDHISINLVQLSKYEAVNKEPGNKEKWIYLLKEGKNMDVDQLPPELNIPEIRQAAEVMRNFSEREEDYLLYESRLDAVRELATWQYYMEVERKAREKAEMKLEQAFLSLQQERQTREQAALQAALILERERQAREQEKEKFIELLKKANIDPDQL